MSGKLLIRGMLAGVIAALAAFIFAHYFGEPQIERAVILEGTVTVHSHSNVSAHSHGDDGEVFSRSTQSGMGLLSGLIMVGAALGGGMALCLALTFRRIGPSDPKILSLYLALGGFLIMSLFPGLKYPPNPPAVGNGETIGYRTVLYFLMLILSMLIIVTSIRIKYALHTHMSAWNASLAGISVGLVLLLLVYQILPAVNEVQSNFPADLLWKFRLSSFGVNFVLWAVLGVTFGSLTQRLFSRPHQQIFAES